MEALRRTLPVVFLLLGAGCLTSPSPKEASAPETVFAVVAYYGAAPDDNTFELARDDLAARAPELLAALEKANQHGHWSPRTNASLIRGQMDLFGLPNPARVVVDRQVYELGDTPHFDRSALSAFSD